MSHWVLSTFKLVYGHLNGNFLTGNFEWAFARQFENSGQKDFAKFLNFDPCTVCGKTLRVSGGVYLPAFWATPLIQKCGPKSRLYCNKGVWPKKQVNKPLLKPAMFCRTLCRGQNFKISQNPFAHCLQMVWWRLTQNCQLKSCRLVDHIPIWKWAELGGTYGMYLVKL